MRIFGLAWLILVVTPRLAPACATCLASSFGDQTYTWPYLALILLPFGLIAAIAGILGYHAGDRPLAIVRRLAARCVETDDPQIIKETL